MRVVWHANAHRRHCLYFVVKALDCPLARDVFSRGIYAPHIKRMMPVIQLNGKLGNPLTIIHNRMRFKLDEYEVAWWMKAHIVDKIKQASTPKAYVEHIMRSVRVVSLPRTKS